MTDPSTQPCSPALTDSVPLFDPGQMPLRTWCAGSREDPLTGLVAFPDFHSHLPRELATALLAGDLVALAIGDVDGLKDHVETANATDPDCFGHLAGNKVMAQLGATTRTWFHQQPWTSGCAATFGGDEVIIAAAVDDPSEFHTAIGELRDGLAAVLPTRVSFALAITCADHLPTDRRGSRWKHTFTDRLLGAVDRCLFAHKAARRSTGGGGGIIAVTEVPSGAPGTITSPLHSLLPLPSGVQTLHATARPAALAGRPVLMLPCTGPKGLRGQRFRISYPHLAPRTEVVVSARGQAAIPVHLSQLAGPAIPVTLQPVRPPAARRVPGDLAAALERAGLDWGMLPGHEQAQALHLITESASPAIRDARISAVVRAVATHVGSRP